MSSSLADQAAHTSLSPATVRAGLVLLTGIALIAGFALTGHDAAQQAIGQAGPDLTRLLRAMALLKAGIAAGLVAAILWRLSAAIGAVWFAAYAAATAAMASGPALIWDMAHVIAGAVLLHTGLLAAVVLLWRDPVTSNLLADAIAARRGRSAAMSRAQDRPLFSRSGET
jgi:hypothetical protein